VVRASISLHQQPEMVRGLVQFHKSTAASLAFPPIRKFFVRRGDKIDQIPEMETAGPYPVGSVGWNLS